MAQSSGGKRARDFKVVPLGEGCVGKTSLVCRYAQNKFNDKHVSTLQASFVSKKLELNGQLVNLNIWDTAGQERFHALGPIYYRDANGAILVYDITDEDSFTKVRNWVKELRKVLGDNVCLAIVGNKIDLQKDQHVPLEMAEQYATNVSADHYYASAKMNRGVEELFTGLSRKMLVKFQPPVSDSIVSHSHASATAASGGSAAALRASQRKSGVLVVEDSDPNAVGAAPKKGGCC